VNGQPLDRGLVLVTWSGYEDDPAHAVRLAAAGLEVRYSPRVAERAPSEVAELVHDAVAVIADADPFDDEVLRRAASLRMLVRIGVGLDSVDLDAATRRGVVVTTTPGVVHEIVAEHTLALALAVLRRIVENDTAIRAGTWARLGPATPWQLTGATVGIVGFGRIGRSFARRLAGFDTRILVHDPYASDLVGVDAVSLDELLTRSDLVVLNAALTDETVGLIGRDQLNRMKPHAVLVNTGRGRLVEEAALYDALATRAIRGAGLDVYELEPPTSEALRSLPNVVLSPHIAGASVASVHEMTSRAIDDLLEFLEGGSPSSIVNPDALKRR
jgi:phosphoglycerate dehydrogenase-like enzyme